MDGYEILSQLGDGTFGCVVKALHRKTGQMVAVKKMKQKYYSWEECMKLPEVAVMRRIQGHPNIVKMREVIREKNELFFVFEYMDGDLLGVIRKAKQMDNHSTASVGPAIGYPKIKSYVFQILQSLAYLHRQGYFHRDMKPENLLIRKDPSSTPQEVVKLADFGLVKEVRGRLPFTDYVSTRWYRAPELLLQDRAYNSPVDIWAVGCIMAELITTRPLFAGSNEVDQLQKIMTILGSPNEQTWPEGMVLAKKIRYSFPAVRGVGLERVLPSHIPPQALDLMRQMLNYDPKKRPTAQQCLQHPYFSVGVDEENIAPSSVSKRTVGDAKNNVAGPQSAPSGNVNPTAVVTPKRSPTLATTAVSKVTGSLLSSQQKFYPQGSTAKQCVAAAAGQKTRNPLPLKPLQTRTSDLDGEKKDTKEALPSSSAEKPKSDPLAFDDAGYVDLNSLVSEFAGELKTLGLYPQQKKTNFSPKEENTKIESSIKDAQYGDTALERDKSSAISKDGDILASLLSSTRYKRSSLRDVKYGPTLHPLGKAPLHTRDPLPLQNPTVDGGHHVASPSIKTLLARHREGKPFRSLK